MSPSMGLSVLLAVLHKFDLFSDSVHGGVWILINYD